MDQKHRHKKTVETKHITLRVAIDAVAALESDSARLGISVNSLANRILRRWARWDRHMQSLGLILVSKDLLAVMLQDNDEKDVSRFVNCVLPIFQDAVMLIKGEYGLKSSIDTLEDYMQSMGIPTSHAIEGNMHYLIINHKMGVKWSMFIKMLLANVFVKFAPDKNVEYEMDENRVLVKMSLGSDWDELD